MSNKIKHSGVVESVSDDCLRVRIHQTSACASCGAAGHCNAAESKEKVIDVYGAVDSSSYKVGQTVTVVASLGTGWRAVTLAFIIPFLILIVVLFGGSLFTENEAMLAIVSMACLIPYYIILYGCRNRLREQFAFHVE